MIRDGKKIVFETKEELCIITALLQYFKNTIEADRTLTEKDIDLDMYANLLEMYNELRYMNRTEF